QVVGWDVATQKGAFVSGDPEIGFAGGPEAKAVAQGIIDQGVDVIMPVGGPDYQPAAAIIKEGNKDIALLGVDADLYETDPDPAVKAMLLTSVRKLIDAAVHDTVMAAKDGSYTTDPY